jgi:flagellar biogenesis protein FliO
MRHLVLLSMMAVASAQANAETCVLRTPLKATRPTNLQRWESLPVGAELSVVLRKADWTRVLRGETMHIVATTQLAAGCTPKTEPKTEPKTTATPAKTETAKAETTPARAETAKAETTPAKAEAPAATVADAAKTEPKTEAPAATVADAAKADTKAETTTKEPETAKEEAPKTKLALATTTTSSASSGQIAVIGLLLLGAVFTAAFLRRRTVVEQQHLDVVASRTLGRGKQLVVVDAGDSRLLLGVTEQGITVLSSTPAGAGRPLAMPSVSSAPSLLTTEEEAAAASPAASLFKGLGGKMTGLWGRPPAGPPSDWDNFDRILASTMPESGPTGPAADAPPSNSRRPAERSSSVTGAADLAELTRELQRHGVRRSA